MSKLRPANPPQGRAPKPPPVKDPAPAALNLTAGVTPDWDDDELDVETIEAAVAAKAAERRQTRPEASADDVLDEIDRSADTQMGSDAETADEPQAEIDTIIAQLENPPSPQQRRRGPRGSADLDSAVIGRPAKARKPATRAAAGQKPVEQRSQRSRRPPVAVLTGVLIIGAVALPELLLLPKSSRAVQRNSHSSQISTAGFEGLTEAHLAAGVLSLDANIAHHAPRPRRVIHHAPARHPKAKHPTFAKTPATASTVASSSNTGNSSSYDTHQAAVAVTPVAAPTSAAPPASSTAKQTVNLGGVVGNNCNPTCP